MSITKICVEFRLLCITLLSYFAKYLWVVISTWFLYLVYFFVESGTVDMLETCHCPLFQQIREEFISGHCQKYKYNIFTEQEMWVKIKITRASVLM